MSRHALRPCGEPGCPVLVEAGRCPAHMVERRKDVEQARFYGSARWKQLRDIVRRRDPACTVCRFRPSEQVHHKDGDWKHNDLDNLAGICRTCHAEESGRQHRRKREG